MSAVFVVAGFIVAGASRSAWTEGGLRWVRAGSAGRCSLRGGREPGRVVHEPGWAVHEPRRELDWLARHRRQWPDLPPSFSTSWTLAIVTPRSTAFTMSYTVSAATAAA